MASIQTRVLKRAAELYRQQGNTWAKVAAILASEGYFHSREYLARRCMERGLLAKDGFEICVLCKAEFEKSKPGKRDVLCPSCKETRGAKWMRKVKRRQSAKEEFTSVIC